MKLLECENVSKYFGKFTALDNLSFDIEEGELYGIAGPNGAGKTTLINVISGVYPQSSGKIKFLGNYIQDLPAHRRCHLGMARTFQIPTFFPRLTVEKNVQVGATFGAKKPKDQQDIMNVLESTWLRDKKDVMAESLSLFEKKRLMMAAALITEPRLLMLDEPIAGLNPAEIQESMQLIKAIHNQGITVIIIEHVMRALMGLSEKVMILHQGRKLAEGSPEEIVKNEDVVEVYLGEKSV